MVFAANSDAAFAILGCTAVFVIGILMVFIFFHITLMKAIQACAPRNQAMAPGLVWLNFVPFLNLVWQFVNVIQVGNSLQAEYRDRGLRSDDESFDKTLGLSYIILGLVANGINVVGNLVGKDIDEPGEPGLLMGVRILVMVLALVQIILIIVYWVKIAGFTRELNEAGGKRDRYEDEERDGRGRRSRYDGEGDRDYDRKYDRRRDNDDDDRRPPLPPPAEVANTVVNCPECKERLGVAAEDLGHDMTCPICAKVFTASPDEPPRAPRRDDRDDDARPPDRS